MAYSREFMEYLADQAAEAGQITYRLMFGAYSVYLDGKLIGIAGDGEFFVKNTRAGREQEPALPLVPPYPGAKPYLQVDFFDDRERLCRFLRETKNDLP